MFQNHTFVIFLMDVVHKVFCKSYFSHLYTNTVLGVSVRPSVCLSVCSCAIETTFPSSNFKTEHIFGILMTLQKIWDHMGRHRHPIFFFNAAAQNEAPEAPQFFCSFYLSSLPPPKTAPLEDEGNAAGSGCFASNYVAYELGLSVYKNCISIRCLPTLFLLQVYLY